jgi:hypothetical protein
MHHEGWCADELSNRQCLRKKFLIRPAPPRRKREITMKKRSLIRVSAIAAFVALVSAAAPFSAEADSVYVTGSGNEFGTLDLSSGTFSQIATLALPGGDFIYGMGFGADHNLYGLDAEPDAHLWQINPGNGNLTDLGAIGQSALDATSDASGKFYVLSQDVNAIYYTMNPPSATPSVVGPIGLSSGGLMAVSADGTQLFTTTPSTTTSTYNLVSLDPNTGAATILGDTGFTVDAGLFVGGTLYGFDTTTDAIVTLNTSTGAGTQVATYSLPNGDLILSAASVPEPSSLLLLAIGAAAVGCAGLSRRKVSLFPR